MSDLTSAVQEGGSSLHEASACDKSGEIVRRLLDEGADIERVDDAGCRPIHVAAYWGMTGAVRVLVDEECLLDVVNENDETSLDLAVLKCNNSCMEILRVAMRDEKLVKDNRPWKIMDPQSCETVFDRCKKIPRMMAAIKAKPVSKQEVKEWISSIPAPKDSQSLLLIHECMLYRCIRHDCQSGFVTLCSPEIVNRGTLLMGPSALETAAEFEGVLFVAYILKRLDKVDESWTRAAALAEKNEFTNISLLLSERMLYLRDTKERGYSRLHISLYDNDPDMVRYILENKLCDPEVGDKTVGTALSLAYSLGQMSCVRCLQDNNANVNTTDRLGQSPLYLAIVNKREDYCEYLVENMRDIEAVKHMGLSMLTLSVMKDCGRICERIVGRMDSVDHNVQIDDKLLDADPDLRMVLGNPPHIRITHRETLSSLCLKVNRTIYPCFLNKLDQHSIDSTDGDNNTLLHLCAVLLLPDLCHQLILRSASVTSVNDSGETPLLALMNENYHKHNKDNDVGFVNPIVETESFGGRADVTKASEFEMNMITTVGVLITAGSSVNVETSKGLNLLGLATEYNSESLLLALVKRRERISMVKEADWLSWFHSKYFLFIAEVLPLIDKSLLSGWITVRLLKRTATVADLSLVKALYDMALNDVQTNVVETILYAAATNSNETLFEEMAKNQISSKSSLEGGESLLNCLIWKRRTRFCRTLLDSRNVDILLEKKDVENKLPLHVCIEIGHWDIVDQMIRETRSVNEEDNDGNTPLSLLFVKISDTEEEDTIKRLMEHVRTLIARSADIYKKNKQGREAISYCTNSGLQLQIEGLFQENELLPQLVSGGVPSKSVEESEAPHSSTAVAGAADNTICLISCDERINCALACDHEVSAVHEVSSNVMDH